MNAKMKKQPLIRKTIFHILWLILLAIGSVVLWQPGYSEAQSSLLSIGNVTASPTPMLSFFKDDICTPPCWFGLIPGESTSADVEMALKQHTHLFYGGFGEETDGYSFLWSRSMGPLMGGDSFLTISNGTLGWMRIMADEAVTLEQTLASFGPPEYVRTNIWPEDLFLDLFYPELRIVVVLMASIDECTIENVPQSYSVAYVFYYPDGGFEELETSQHLNVAIEVPLDRWDMWLGGKMGQTCIDEFASLSRIAATATQAAALSATPSPIATATPAF